VWRTETTDGCVRVWLLVAARNHVLGLDCARKKLADGGIQAGDVHAGRGSLLREGVHLLRKLVSSEHDNVECASTGRPVSRQAESNFKNMEP
jgi:hypothetical protein